MTALKTAWAWVKDHTLLLAGAVGAVLFFLWRKAVGDRNAAEHRAAQEGHRADEAAASAKRERTAAEVARKTAERLAEKKAAREEIARKDTAAAEAEVAEVRVAAAAKKSLADEVNKRIDTGRL